MAPLTSNPCHSCNISDLTIKTMNTNVYNAHECIQIERREMKKWKPHPFSKQVHQGGNWVVGEIQKFTSWYTVEYISILTILIIKEFICHIK